MARWRWSHSGDMVTLDVARRLVQLEVDDATLAARRAEWTPPALPERGWERLYVEHVSKPIWELIWIFLWAKAAPALLAIPTNQRN